MFLTEPLNWMGEIECYSTSVYCVINIRRPGDSYLYPLLDATEITPFVKEMSIVNSRTMRMNLKLNTTFGVVLGTNGEISLFDHSQPLGSEIMQVITTTASSQSLVLIQEAPLIIFSESNKDYIKSDYQANVIGRAQSVSPIVVRM